MKTEHCYVYAIEAQEERSTKSYIKIGISNDVEKRMTELSTGCPFNMRIAKKTKCSSRENALLIEKMIHEKLKFFNLHARNEWFVSYNNDGIDVLKIFNAASKFANREFMEDEFNSKCMFAVNGKQMIHDKQIEISAINATVFYDVYPSGKPKYPIRICRDSGTAIDRIQTAYDFRFGFDGRVEDDVFCGWKDYIAYAFYPWFNNSVILLTSKCSHDWIEHDDRIKLVNKGMNEACKEMNKLINQMNKKTA